MPVIKRFGFRKNLNENLLKRDIAKRRLIASKNELAGAKHSLKSMPKPKSVPSKEKADVFRNRRKQIDRINKLEGNAVKKQVEFNSANKKVESAKSFRKSPGVSQVRMGQTIANIFLGSNNVTSITQKMNKVFRASKNKSSRPVLRNLGRSKLSYPKGSVSKTRGLRR